MSTGMSNQTKNSSDVQQSLLFIPDISGFTQFVSDTETSHAQHIIQELLEILISANQIGLKVSEVEGDAILFYRYGKAPTVVELLSQVQKMFVDFHAHLKKYETHRICHCGACQTAHNLTLKFISHYGSISENQIRQHTKLFGKDVIVAHHLLKNDLQERAYVLFTHALVSACSTWVELPDAAWAPVQSSEQEYESGPVEFCYLPLTPLMEYVPEPTLEDYTVGPAKDELFQVEGTVEAPLEMVFNVLADLPFRNQWKEGLDPDWTIDTLNSRVTQHGSTHRCLSGGPVMISHDFEREDDVIRFTETNKKDQTCAVYTMRRMDEQRTLVQMAFFMKPNLIKKVIATLLFKKKHTAAGQMSLKNLNQYCKKLLQEGKAHPQTIVLAA